MDWVTPLYILIALLLVLLNGFFVLAEFSLVKARATRLLELERAGNRRARVAHKMVADLDRYLAATQLGITVASLGLGWVGEPAFSGVFQRLFGPLDWSSTTRHSVSAALSFVIITFMHILIGELAPKSLAIRRPESSAMAVSYGMLMAYRLFYLPMVVLNGASNWILRLVGLEAAHAELAHTQQEMRLVLASVQPSAGFTITQLLMLENVFDFGQLTVKDAMIPWSRAVCLTRDAGLAEVLKLLGEHRFSRYAVLERANGRPTGYLLAKDLIVGTAPPDWTSLIRPLRVVAPHDRLETTMQQLQKEGTNLAVVTEGERPVGLITLEDILEEIVGRIEDEYPRLPRLFLKDMLAAGGVVLKLDARTAEEAIRTLAAVIPPQNLPAGADVAALALAHERQMATDVGHGVAIPHARCQGLERPLLVFGRSTKGITFDAESAQPVRLVFLAVTPAERPNVQVFLLSQLATVARADFIRERLHRAKTAQELIDIIAAADPAVTG